MKHNKKHSIPHIAVVASQTIIKKKYVTASVDIIVDLPVTAKIGRAKRKKAFQKMYAARHHSKNSCSISLSPKAMQTAIDSMEIKHKIPSIVAASFSKFSKHSKASKYA